MNPFSKFFKSIIRFLILWVVDGVSLLVVAGIMPGISFTPTENLEKLILAYSAAFVLSLVNLLIRPLVLMIARPLGFIAVFVIGFLVNAIALWLTGWLLAGFEVDGLIVAILGGLFFAAINVVLTGILDVNEQGSLYQNRMERMAKREPYDATDETGRGLVMVEIDGLSFHHIKHALQSGQMPFLQSLIDESGYALTRVDCGLPSQTSACQAGILFGDNFDIPAFRWYDKDQQKLYVSSKDAQEINARYAKGNGLLRGGSSISNMMNGDASKSLFTLADLKTADAVESQRRSQDIYLLMLDPYFLMRTLVFFFADVVRELWQGWQQVRHDVQPRLNRLHQFYPFVRAGTTVVLRELGTNLTVLDIVRGAPAIYFTWPGYDEVAHHSGPWTSDAFKVLQAFDNNLERIYEAAKQRAPRAYDVLVLSDHGQSFGATFLQRYGMSLKEFIEQQIPTGVTVSQVVGGDTGLGPLTAVGAELGNMQSAEGAGVVGKQVAKQGQRLIEKGTAARQETEGASAEAAPNGEIQQVVAYGSGNLAQVYFDLLPRKITLSELNTAYPGMVDALVQHDGIGMVCGYEDDGTPVCLARGGKRNLHSGEVTGVDPLAMYAPQDANAFGRNSLETRAWQVRRVMDFPHAGDLMVISAVYPDGTVAALEELIGSHGGLGGEQTDAFLLHPATLAVPDLRNSAEVFGVLDARRGEALTAQELQAEAETKAQDVDEWSLSNLWGGIRNVALWVPLALRALTLDRAAYQQVADDPSMTGPGLLLGLLFSLPTAISVGRATQNVAGSIGAAIVAWFLMTLAVFLAGRFLSRRGYYTRTMRSLGFANITSVVVILALLPGFAGIATVLLLVFTFLASWMAASEAHDLKGWRGLLLPVVAIAIAILAPFVVIALLSSAAIGLESIRMSLGLTPQP